jgi:WD40 repeat protein
MPQNFLWNFSSSLTKSDAVPLCSRCVAAVMLGCFAYPKSWQGGAKFEPAEPAAVVAPVAAALGAPQPTADLRRPVRRGAAPLRAGDAQARAMSASTPPETLLKSALDKARRENAALQDRVAELEDTVRSLKRSIFLLSIKPAGAEGPAEISALLTAPAAIARDRAAAAVSHAAVGVSGAGADAAGGRPAAVPAASAKGSAAGEHSASDVAAKAAAATKFGDALRSGSIADAAAAAVAAAEESVGAKGTVLASASSSSASASASSASPGFTPFIERVDLKAHTAAVYAVRFSPDGSHLVSASFDRSVVVWGIDNHVGENSRPQLSIPDAHRAPVVAVEWADATAGSRLLTGGFDASAAEWDVAASATTPIARYHTRGIVNAVSVSPGNPHIFFAATARCAVHMFDRRAPLRNGSATPAGSAGPAASMDSTRSLAAAPSPLSAAARAAHDESTVIVDNDAAVNSVHVEYDGLRIITGDHAGVIKTFDLRMVTSRALANSRMGVYKAKPASLIDSMYNDPERRPITHVHSSPAAAVDDNGRCLAVNSYDNYLRVYDRGAFLIGSKTAALRPLHALRGVVNRNWPIKSSFFVGADYRPPRAVARREPVVRRAGGTLMNSPSNKSLASRRPSSYSFPEGGESWSGSFLPSRQGSQQDVATGSFNAEEDGGESSSSIDSAEDLEAVFDSTSDEDDDEEHVVRRGGSQPRTKGTVYRPGEMPIQSAFLLASGSADGNIYVFDIGGVPGSGARVQRIRGHRDRVHSVEFHPTEPMLASCSADCTVKLWSPGKSGP